MTAHVTLAGDLNANTSAAAIHRRQGLEPISTAEFEQRACNPRRS
jgi:hypothetical protein